MGERVITVIKANEDGTIDKSTRIGKGAEEYLNDLPIMISAAEVNMTKEVQRKLLKKKE